MQPNDRTVLRKPLIALVVVLFLWLLGVWLYNTLTTAHVSVQTNNPNYYVSVTALKNGVEDSSHEQQGQYRLSANVSPGTYKVAAFNHSSVVSKIITVRARQHLAITLNLIGASTPSPVYGSNVTDLAASGSQLTFIDSDGLLTSIAGDGAVNKLSSGATVASAKWASATLGIARSRGDDFYVVNNGGVTKLNLPFMPPPNSIVNYDVLGDGEIYVTSGGDIYKGDPSGAFTRLYSSKGAILSMSASSSTIAIAESNNPNSPDPEGSVKLINVATGHATNTSVTASSLGWSRDGKYLLLADESGQEIFTATMKRLAVLPSSTTGYAWGNDDEFFYGQGGSLMMYSLNSGQSVKLADMPSQGTISGIYPDFGGDYVYVAASVATVASDTASNGQLFRVGLKGQQVNSSYGSLAILFPANIQSCSFNYTNFSQPLILIGYPSPDAQQSCQDVAQSTLESNNIDATAFRYSFSLLGSGD